MDTKKKNIFLFIIVLLIIFLIAKWDSFIENQTFMIIYLLVFFPITLYWIFKLRK